MLLRASKEKLLLSKEFMERELGNIEPHIAVILGSGFGNFVEKLDSPVAIPYHKIPSFPVTTVKGHSGNLVFGSFGGKNVMVMQGRFHYYEGHNMENLTFPIKLLRELGVEKLIVTSSSLGINTKYNPGDLMVIEDHINLTGRNPLRGWNDDNLGPRFTDLSQAYDLDLIKCAMSTAKEMDINLHRGIYTATNGPSFETPAEIRYMRIIGGDAVGMSTVPEVIMANYLGMDVLGIACISGMGAGVRKDRIDHEELMQTVDQTKDEFADLLSNIIRKLDLSDNK